MAINSQTKQLHFTNEELASIVALLEMFSDKRSLLQGAAGEDALDVRDVLSAVRELQAYRAQSNGPSDSVAKNDARYRWLREQKSLSVEGKNSDWSGGYFPDELDEWIDRQRSAATDRSSNG